MERHPYFDLILHTAQELESYLGSVVTDRQTLHEWPLSCVQLLKLADGRRLVYKTSSGPTVEAQFYAQAHSAVLVHYETVYQDDKYTCLVFEYLDAPCLSDCKFEEKEALQVGQRLQAEISRITGQIPFYMDISTWDGWQSRMDELLKGLYQLISQGSFRIVTQATVAKIECHISTRAVREVIDGPSGLIHNDLTDENIFIFPDGYRIIDWQRPIFGPLGLDLATLGESLGYNPVEWVDPAIWTVKSLLHIHWFTQCAVRWFPAGSEIYDQQIAELAAKNL